MYYRYEEALQLYERRHGHRPGYREIATATGISSATIRKIVLNKPVNTRSLEKVASYLEMHPARFTKDREEPVFYDDEI